ncbi:Thiamin-phosphate pyrophosphorylase [hydrothermal vent metagenome]|uniref:Thiamin-phosphate pyrophosphorylase n=1 Tax=hydrothermal vent metagenome TaxID=652676 RepID=A0A3B0T9Y9_9ZZZZ
MSKAMPDGPTPGVCLLTPADLGRDLLAGEVAAALGHGAAEVIIVTRATQKSAPGGRLRDLRALARRLGKVFLVENDIGRAVELEAEGMLVADLEGLAGARKTLGGGAMVGVRCGLSRHGAMEAGEAGADFIALEAVGEAVDGSVKLAEHIAWWSQLFEIPGVALGAANPGDAEVFLDAGADFVGLGDPLWSTGDMVKILDMLVVPKILETGAGTK